MKLIRRVLPNLCIAMTLALVTLLILDSFNPLLGLLRGLPFLILSLLDAAAAIICAAVLYGDSRRS